MAACFVFLYPVMAFDTSVIIAVPSSAYARLHLVRLKYYLSADG